MDCLEMVPCIPQPRKGDTMQTSQNVDLERIEREIIESISFYRGMTLDAVELLFSDPDCPQWRKLRKQLLKIFGDRGLEGRVLEILTGNANSQQAGRA